jgi:hypothetical protein
MPRIDHNSVYRLLDDEEMDENPRPKVKKMKHEKDVNPKDKKPRIETRRFEEEGD